MARKTSKKQPNQYNKEALTIDRVRAFQHWARPLKTSLSLEAETDFKNIQGRNEFFNQFVERQLQLYPEFLTGTDKNRLDDFSMKFRSYSEKSESLKRRLVIDLRRYLHQLSTEFVNPEQESKPFLKRSSTINNYSSNLPGSISLMSPLVEVPGIGAKLGEKLLGLGLLLVKDLVTYYPRDYVDYSSLKRINELIPGETSTIVATIRRCSSFTSPRNPNLSILELQLQDKSGRIKVTKFYAGRRFSSRSFLKGQERLYPVGSKVAVSGLVKDGKYGRSFNDPLLEILDHSNSQVKSTSIGRLISIYSLCEGLSAEKFRGFVKSVLPLVNHWQDPVPENILKEIDLPSKSKALCDIHFPDDKKTLQRAKRRLVFDEFFSFQLSLLLRRLKFKKDSAPKLEISTTQNGLVGVFFKSLPFSLTISQRTVLTEIHDDLKKNEPMARLLQGDVGSGKTVVAIASLLYAVEAGWQGALMAPTEVLAEQHYRNLCQWLIPLHVNVELLTGSTRKSRRRDILDNLATGNLNILVGTHALIEDPVSFNRLGLVVVDEQHRFGVRQRNLLLNKGLQPHLLTMTATPIPRTLALSIHGDLDVSQINELPPGRTPVKTRVFERAQINKVYSVIRDEIAKGRQAYFVLPLVDESEKLELRSAIKVHKELSEDIFPNLKVGLLFGKMAGASKQRVIQEFIEKKFDILVSTTVIEVGVDVSNATVMVIDNADRFGLSQLHQLRGRVGRGSARSNCFLVCDDNRNSGKARLEVLSKSNDGFEIAEIDLKLRGPGQVLGTKQSGLPDFALANLINDADVLEIARQQAEKIIDHDPTLDSHLRLKEWLHENYDKFFNQVHLN